MSGKVLWALPIWTGLALFLSFPRPSLFFLAWGGLAPFLVFVWSVERLRALIGGHFLMSSLYFGGVLYWIPGVLTGYGGLGDLVAWGAYALMVFVLGLFLLPFSLACRFTAGYGKAAMLITAPAWWMITELLRNYLAVNGFPWAALGYSQFGFPLLTQSADIGGIYLVSGLVVVVNCLILSLFWSEKRIYIGFGALLLIFLFYGGYRLWIWNPEPVGTIRAGLLQGDIALQESREYYARKYFSVLPSLAEKAWEEGAEWIIIPEAQCPYFMERDFYFRTFWERKADQGRSWILMNSTRMDRDEIGRYFNSAYLLEPRKGITYVYDKIHLVPFGEYLPFASLFSWVGPLVSEVSSYTPGEGIGIGRLGERRFGTLICYEDVFPELGRLNARVGAEILVNITNDLWYGPTAAPEQHLQIAAFRCIETRRTLLRAANSGYSAVVDPWGRVVRKSRLFQEESLVEDAHFHDCTTVFTLLGNLPVIFIFMAAAGFTAFRIRASGDLRGEVGDDQDGSRPEAHEG